MAKANPKTLNELVCHTATDAAAWWREQVTQRENEILQHEFERLQLGPLTLEKARESGLTLCVQQGKGGPGVLSSIVWVDRFGVRVSPKWELGVEFEDDGRVSFVSKCIAGRPA